MVTVLLTPSKRISYLILHSPVFVEGGGGRESLSDHTILKCHTELKYQASL